MSVATADDDGAVWQNRTSILIPGAMHGMMDLGMACTEWFRVAPIDRQINNGDAFKIDGVY